MKRVTKDKIEGAFAEIDDAGLQEIIMEIVANFHFRNGKQNDDGSLGKIEITPGELNDAIAYVLTRVHYDSNGWGTK